jgi:hypothetical protein
MKKRDGQIIFESREEIETALDQFGQGRTVYFTDKDENHFMISDVSEQSPGAPCGSFMVAWYGPEAGVKYLRGDDWVNWVEERLQKLDDYGWAPEEFWVFDPDYTC